MASWRIWTVLVGLLLVGCAPRLPSAARLVFASPAPDAVLGALPETLALHFSEDLDAAGSSASVLDAAGQELGATVRVDPSDARALQVQLAEHAATGRFTVNWRTLSAASRTTADGVFGFSVEPGAPEQPRLAVSPGLTEIGQPITVSGSGFEPGAAIALTVADDQESLGSAQADASGAFTETPTLPNDVPFGVQPILARDEQGSSASGAISVRWGGWPPVRVYTLATPGPDTGQVTFTVVGRNRSDYVLEGVRITLEIPSGAAVLSTSDGALPQPGSVVWDEGVLDRTSLIPRSVTVSAAGPVVGRARIEFRHRRASGCIGDQCLPAFVDETHSMSGSVTPAP